MGACTTKQAKKDRKGDLKSTKIQINCPICEENYDTNHHKPYLVCQNKHKFCLSCLQSMSNHTSLKKKSKLLCPFCKMEINEDMKQTDVGMYKFLQAELNIMKQLPDNQKNLFAFSSIYLPTLHKFMTDQVNKGKSNKSIESIDMLRIKGRMLQEYQVFEMGMLDCIKGLKKIYLSNNHIRAIDTTLYTQNKLQLMDLSKNKLSNIKNVLEQAKGVFAFLKVLKIDNNLIDDLTGIDRFKYIQVVSASHNAFKEIKFFANCPQLRFLNLQFNKITKYGAALLFTTMYACINLIVGNSITENEWQKAINLTNWKELRLLTASVITQNLIDVYSAHRKIEKKLSSSVMLKLIVFQMGEESLENMSGVTQNISNKKQLLSKTRIVQITANNYSFFIQNKGFVHQIIQLIVRYHPLGYNCNFRPQHITKEVYQEDDNIYLYKKIGSFRDTRHYLYSAKLTTEKESIFIGFKVKPCQMTLGICQGLPYKRIIELDAGRQLFNLNKQAKQEDTEVYMSLNMEANYVSFICGETTLKRFFSQRWQEYRFFVNMAQQGGEITVIRNQISII